MKKQHFLIVLLSILVVGLAPTTYGQTLVPRAITCLSADALHPIAGTPYNYTVNVPTPPGTKSYQWMVTQDETFITNKILVATPELNDGTSTVLAGSGAGYNDPATGTSTISLTWKSFTYDPANPVFVIINVVNDDGSCSPNNMKVFKIMPMNAFTLDIANMDSTFAVQAGYGASFSRCMSPIISASYDATAPEGVLYDFGKDAFYYIVTAANWSGEWQPRVTLSGIDAEETIESVEWSATTTFATTHAFTLNAGIWESTDRVQPSSGGTVGAAGELIFIRVILDHTNLTLNYEGLTNETVVLAVDGINYATIGATTGGLGDVHYDNGANTPPCPPLVVDLFANDIATQVLKPRPDVQATTPTPFLPVKP